MKSIIQLVKLRLHGQWVTLFRTLFLVGFYLVPTRFLAPMAASKIGPPVGNKVMMRVGGFAPSTLQQASEQIFNDDVNRFFLHLGYFLHNFM
jgi:hypothetical protein